MSDLFDLRFLFVVGKGGVGRTTVSAAMALEGARRGKRVLVAMCNAKERLSHLLEVEPIGPRNQEVLPGLSAVNMVPKVAMEEYGMMVLKKRSLYQAVFENRLVASFLRGTPGLEAWTMLGKAFYHSKETGEDGRARYDIVILDAPATGNGLDMLRVPQVIESATPAGPLRRDAVEAMELFCDPQQAGVVMVTLPEEMPVNETIELHAVLRDELRLPIQRVVVNARLPALFAEGSEWVERLAPELGPGSALAPMAEAGRARWMRETAQRTNVERLTQAIQATRIELPYLFLPDFRRGAVESLSHAFR